MTYEIIVDCGRGLYVAQSGIKTLKELNNIFVQYNTGYNLIYIRKLVKSRDCSIRFMWRLKTNKTQKYFDCIICDYKQNLLNTAFNKCVGEY